MADDAQSAAEAGSPHDARQLDIDWPALRAAATEVMTKAYVPYSTFPVEIGRAHV